MPLESAEKQLVNARVLILTCLLVLVLAPTVYCAWQSQATVEGVRFAWLGGMILGIAATFVVFKGWRRMVRVWLRGEKEVLTVKIAQKVEHRGKPAFLLDGIYLPVHPDVYARHQKGDRVRLHRLSPHFALYIESDDI